MYALKSSLAVDVHYLENMVYEETVGCLTCEASCSINHEVPCYVIS
jgi:hypothetical protein